jgi:polysaccharide export outer membrane protein
VTGTRSAQVRGAAGRDLKAITILTIFPMMPSRLLAMSLSLLAWLAAPAAGQPQKPPAAPPQTASKTAASAVPGPSVTPPADYVIGPDDVLGVVFWREKDMSVEQVVVRPDGMITLPLLNDVKAAGLTPEQLRQQIMQAANRYVEEPNATVVVRTINSRKVYVTGQVAKAGPYPLTSSMTVLQAIAVAGGLLEYAKQNDIVVVRNQGGKTQTFKFRYKDVIQGKKLEQNIELKPGDTILVP